MGKGKDRKNDGLTGRQAEVARLMAEGLSRKEIAARLGIRPDTAHQHERDVLGKLGCNRRAQAAVLILRGGLDRLPHRPNR